MKATPDTSDKEKYIANGLLLSGKKSPFFYECTMQQFVPHHMHFRWPSGKCINKKYVAAIMKHLLSQMISRSVGILVLK